MKPKTESEMLAEIWAEIPQEITSLTPEEISRMAAEDTERYSEGRIHRPSFRQNPHCD